MKKQPTEEKSVKYERPEFRSVSEKEVFAGYGQQSYYSPEEQQSNSWFYYSNPYYSYYPYYSYNFEPEPQGTEQFAAEESGNRTPFYSLRDETERYLLEVELPGAEPQEIDVYVGNYDVVVTTDPGGDVKSEDNSLRRFYGTLEFPEEINAEFTETQYSNGILYLKIAKLKPPVRKHIKIDEGSQENVSA